jgi:hypothetical protein
VQSEAKVQMSQEALYSLSGLALLHNALLHCIAASDRNFTRECVQIVLLSKLLWMIVCLDLLARTLFHNVKDK